MFYLGWFYQKASQKVGCFVPGDKSGMRCFVQSVKSGMGCFVLVAEMAWDVLYGLANLCEMICLWCLKWHGMFCSGMICPVPY